MSAVEIQVVTTADQMDRFIRLPGRLYAADPNFVAPLRLERKEALSPKKNPYFEHAEVQFFMARRDGRDIGRISAQIDHLVPDASIGHFGMIVAEDDAAIFEALFAAAEGWLRERGRSVVRGPFNLSINEESGLLVDGFDTPPMMFMAHDPRYIAARIEALGYAKAKDLYAYLYDMRRDLPPAARKFIDRRKPIAMTARNLDMQRYDAEFDTITDIFNDAWSENWGFVPFTPAEIRHMAKSLKPLIDPSWVAIVEMHGEPVGFGITLPNLNEAIADFGGRLLPFNWIRLLLRLKKGPRSARVPLMGIRRSSSAGLLGGVIPFLIIDKMRQGVLRRNRVERVELSWILEDNMAMRRMIESLDSVPYKTYRVYEKTLA